MSHARTRPRTPATLLPPALLVTTLVTGVVAAPAHGSPQEYDKEPTATGTGGAVASLDPYASLAGVEILEAGGNAVDAAVAASATLGVTRPYDGSVGGGGFMVIYSAQTGEVTTIDSREEAWAAMEPDVFLDDEGQPIPFAERRVSGLSQGVPGVVRGWERALREHGTMDLDRVLERATTIAEEGFVVDAEYVRRTQENLDIFRDFTSSSETFLVDGDVPQEGSLVTNEDLARTYRLLAEEGADVFYEGEIAEAIVETNTNPPVVADTERVVRPGAMTLADLAGYEALERDPTVVEYRGYEVYGMGPPSSGGSTVGEALNILEGFDLAAMTQEEVLHHLAESSAIAFADRNAYVGDEAFVDVPLTGLLSQEFADERRELIGPEALERPVAAGDPWSHEGVVGPTSDATSAEGTGSTTHLTVADRWGNVVSFTFTIEQIGGSGIAVPGYGFLLNNELTDFEPDPDHPANAPAPGKRPRSSMSPTIVLGQDGSPVAAFGSPGGSTIITTVLQVAVNHLDLGMSLPEAIAAPRLSSRNGAASDAEAGIHDTALGDALRARGHTVDPVATLGNVTGVAFLGDGVLQAAAEPVRSGGGSAMVVRPQEEPPPPPAGRHGFFLTNSWRGGDADVYFMYGRHTDEVLIGDWDGDGKDTITVRRGKTYYVNNAAEGGPAGSVFTYGRADDVVLVGDWDGDGVDTLAVRRGATYHVKDTLRGGEADRVVHYGRAGDDVLVGDWDGDG
ncbi:gamma-glutamyltransferase, partial [uncultured Georgenia sp.]|uniref:gamma-glutamyltransferase n=1 Tax=uncultured Georgenia sp. TaxID=378209 RepID=UPI0026206A08